jgi:hypothetical protein
VNAVPMAGCRRSAILALSLVILAWPRVAEAQVGLTSGQAQVALVARVAPQGSIQGVSPQRQTGGSGAVRETSVLVRLSANTGYQLMVRRTGAHPSRIWVRTVDGAYQELTTGSSAVVARDRHRAGQWEREVHYRIESPEGSDEQPLPVRYEIAVTPTL